MSSSQKPDRLVYSTAHGRMCPNCRRPITECSCTATTTPVQRGPVRVRLDTGGRRGKAVTLITGVPLAAAQLAELGRELKRKCSAGGTVKDGTIEIQGDHCEAVIAELRRRGWKAN
jgi:translation initiation factor 1